MLTGTLFNWILVHFSIGIYTPNLSDSYSLNEKLLFLKNKPKNAEIIAIGSSMTLNNLSSTVVTDAFRTKNFYNAGSWGTSMTDSYKLLKTVYKLYPLKTLIVSSNVIDFQQPDKVADFDDVLNYLDPFRGRADDYLLYNFNLNYYLTNSRYARQVRSEVHNYDALNFDEFGAVIFEAKDFKITKERWGLAFLSDQLNLPGESHPSGSQRKT